MARITPGKVVDCIAASFFFWSCGSFFSLEFFVWSYCGILCIFSINVLMRWFDTVVVVGYYLAFLQVASVFSCF